MKFNPNAFVYRPLKIVLTDLKYDKCLANTFVSHTLFDERRKKYTCYVCMAKFETKDELNDHRRNHPTDSDVEDDRFEEDFIPSIKMDPGKTTPSLTETYNVKTIEKVKKPCTEEPTMTEPKEEKKDVDIKMETSFKCDTCNVYFVSSDDAKRHIASLKCRFACRLCNRKFNTLYAFVVHVMQHKTNAVKNQQSAKSSYLCQACEKSFDDCFQLKRHEIQVHNKKLASYATTATLMQKENIQSKKLVEDKLIITETEVNSVDTNESPDTVGSTLFTCELCYDIFNNNHELEKHMEFHKQLETISEQIVIDDDDEFVEVVEDKSDKHEIKTTMRAAKRPSVPTNAIPSTSTTNVERILYYKNTNTIPIYPKPMSLKQPNKQLSDKIKEMLTPNSEKVSKTIFLSSPLLKTPQKKKVLKKIAIKPTAAGHPELQQTGPLSYSINFSDNKQQNIDPVTPFSATTSSNNTNPYILSNTLSSPSSNLTSTTQYAYVIIPHNNTSPTVVVPTSNISVSLPTQNYGNTITTQSTTLPNDISNGTCISNASLQTGPINISLIQNSDVLTNQNSNSKFHSNASYVSIANLDNVSTSNFLESSNIKDAIRKNDSPNPNSNITIFRQNQMSNNIITTSVESSDNKSYTSSTSKVMSQTLIPEIVIIDSDDEEESSNSSSLEPRSTQPTTNDDEAVGIENTTIDITQLQDVSAMSEKNINTEKEVDDSSDSEAAHDLVIDENEMNESGKQNIGIVDANDIGAQSSIQKQEQSNLKGMISVKKLEDLIEPTTNNSDQGSEKTKRPKKVKKFNFPMKCDGCSVTITRFRSLRVHEKKKHTCTLCDFKCCKIIGLRNHYLTQHNLFFCWRCRCLFDSRIQLEEHRKTHTCKTCSGIYTYLSTHICKKSNLGKETPVSVDASHSLLGVVNSSVNTPD